MRKNRDDSLTPYSFGHKWKDGSLRTDIPLKSLNLHFNVNFSIVSQVNPHINLFFFSPRGSPGRPVTHRRGRGWRGGFLGSSIETSIKLDLQKYLKILRHLELLPRPLGQDWSEIWLQRFSGTITLWPKSVLSDFWHILSDPSPARLERMLQVGENSAWPKIKFVDNRMRIEKKIVEGLRVFATKDYGIPRFNTIDDQEEPDVQGGQENEPKNKGQHSEDESAEEEPVQHQSVAREQLRSPSRLIREIRRQSSVFFQGEETDDTEEPDEDATDGHGESATDGEGYSTGND
jgi:hypothetical protein